MKSKKITKNSFKILNFLSEFECFFGCLNRRIISNVLRTFVHNVTTSCFSILVFSVLVQGRNSLNWLNRLNRLKMAEMTKKHWNSEGFWRISAIWTGCGPFNRLGFLKNYAPVLQGKGRSPRCTTVAVGCKIGVFRAARWIDLPLVQGRAPDWEPCSRIYQSFDVPDKTSKRNSCRETSAGTIYWVVRSVCGRLN